MRPFLQNLPAVYPKNSVSLCFYLVDLNPKFRWPQQPGHIVSTWDTDLNEDLEPDPKRWMDLVCCNDLRPILNPFHNPQWIFCTSVISSLVPLERLMVCTFCNPPGKCLQGYHLVRLKIISFIFCLLLHCSCWKNGSTTYLRLAISTCLESALTIDSTFQPTDRTFQPIDRLLFNQLLESCYWRWVNKNVYIVCSYGNCNIPFAMIISETSLCVCLI